MSGVEPQVAAQQAPELGSRVEPPEPKEEGSKEDGSKEEPQDPSSASAQGDSHKTPVTLRPLQLPLKRVALSMAGVFFRESFMHAGREEEAQ